MRSECTLVLGSNSFAGSHLIHALLEDDPARRVVGVSRSPEKHPVFLPYKGREDGRFSFHQLDMVGQQDALIRLLDETRPDCIINFAALNEVAPSNDHPADYFLTNCVALAGMCDALRRRDYLRQYIHISSPEVYGSCPHPLLESAGMDPSTPYAASKGGADLLLHSLWKTFNFPVTCVRSTNYYGWGQQLHKLIPRTIIRIKQGSRLQLHGGGKAIKSWIHVRDVARGLLACMRKGQPGCIYHLSDENALEVAEVVRRICVAMGRSFEDCTEVVGERPGQDSRYVLDYNRAREELGWLPREPFDAGLREVVEWLEGNWEVLKGESREYRHVSPTL